jgi:phosphoribosylformylglycinamidine synthase
VPLGRERAFIAQCEEHQQPWTPLGVVGSAGGPLQVTDLFDIELPELRAAWSGTLPALFDRPVTDARPAADPPAEPPAADAPTE